jgi:L-malate glycosyltransferase
VIPRIVHVASGREWRGGQRQVWLLAAALNRSGTDQVVVTGSGTELARRLQSSGVRVRTASWQAGLDLRVLWPILQELRRPHAVLHAHDAHSLTLAGICSVLTGAPLVVTRRVAFALRHRFFWRRADRVIVISSAVRNALLAAGLAPERLIVIPDGVDLAEFEVLHRDEVRTSLRLPETGQLAVSLGGLSSEKAQSTLIEAAALLVRDLPGLTWAIVGEGPLRRQLEGQIADRGLQGRVRLMGHMDDPHRALAAADVFVLSSTSEGLGSSILAAMALDVPVVATRVGGIPDLLGSGAGIMVAPANPAEFAAAVLRVLTDSELRQNLTRLAREELRNFSIGAMADQVLQVYRSCVHSLGGS